MVSEESSPYLLRPLQSRTHVGAESTFMSFDIPLHIPDGSPEGKLIEQVMRSENVSAEQAVLRILRDAEMKGNPAQRLIGLFSSPEDAALMDEVDRLVVESRSRK